jgi:chaperonin GroES
VCRRSEASLVGERSVAFNTRPFSSYRRAGKEFHVGGNRVDGYVSQSRQHQLRGSETTRFLNATAPVHGSLESKFMNLRPLHDRIIVQRLEEGEQHIGGIIIPDTAKEKPQQGKVIAAGNGKTKDDGKRVPLDVKAGDRILFGKYAGQEIELGDEEYLIVKEDEVLAVIEGKTQKKK